MEDQEYTISELKVCRSQAGWYIGRMYDEGYGEMPYSRDSQYFKTYEQAQKALDESTYTPRLHP